MIKVRVVVVVEVVRFSILNIPHRKSDKSDRSRVCLLSDLVCYNCFPGREWIKFQQITNNDPARPAQAKNLKFLLANSFTGGMSFQLL